MPLNPLVFQKTRNFAAATKGSAAPFPQEKTADQFFSESQFESYRMLGEHSVQGWAKGEWPSPASADGRASGEVLSPPRPSERDPAEIAASRSSATSRLANTLQSMSKGAAIASAITVGGIVGVTGTVALRDPTVTLNKGAEVNLSQEDRELLRRGLPLTLTTPLKLDVAELTRAVQALQAVIGQEGAASERLSERFTELTRAVQDLERKVALVSSRIPADPIGEIKDIRTDVEQIKKLVVSLGNQKEILVELAKVEEVLRTISANVQETAPRRNIRGLPSEGGK